MQYISVTIIALSLTFAIYTLYLLIQRRDNCLMMWCAGFIFCGLSSSIALVSEIGGFNIILYRLWYLSDNVLSGAFLAIGIIYYMLPRRISFPLLLLLTIALIYAIIEIFIVPINVSEMVILNRRPLPLQIRIISLFFNLSEMVVLIAAIFYGIFSAITKRRPLFYSASLLLMGGGMILPATYSLNLWLDTNVSLSIYIYKLLGLIVFFAGLLIGHAIPVTAEYRSKENM